MVRIKVRTVSGITTQNLKLGQKPWEAEICQSEKGELSTGQREINSGWGTVRGADCPSFGLERKDREAEVSVELATVPRLSPLSPRPALLRARPFRLVLFSSPSVSIK